MVSVDDYSVYVTEIKTALRKVEDYCLKAEVGATEEEFRDAFVDIGTVGIYVGKLNKYITDKRYGQKK
jgi:hypothetical protein